MEVYAVLLNLPMGWSSDRIVQFGINWKFTHTYRFFVFHCLIQSSQPAHTLKLLKTTRTRTKKAPQLINRSVLILISFSRGLFTRDVIKYVDGKATERETEHWWWVGKRVNVNRSSIISSTKIKAFQQGRFISFSFFWRLLLSLIVHWQSLEFSFHCCRSDHDEIFLLNFHGFWLSLVARKRLLSLSSAL